jgi:hypothetical protein
VIDAAPSGAPPIWSSALLHHGKTRGREILVCRISVPFRLPIGFGRWQWCGCSGHWTGLWVIDPHLAHGKSGKRGKRRDRRLLLGTGLATSPTSTWRYGGEPHRPPYLERFSVSLHHSYGQRSSWRTLGASRGRACGQSFPKQWRVRSAALRRCVLGLTKARSVGLKSGL